MNSTSNIPTNEYRDSVGVALRVTIVSLTLATAYIHFTLGSLLFLANAVGYTVLAVAMVLPGAFMVRNRWIARAALAGFTSVTIIGWALIGPRFMLAYVDKGVVPVLLAQSVYLWGDIGVRTIVDKIYFKKDVPPMIPMELVKVTKDNLGTWARQLKAWGFTDVPESYLSLK